MLWGVPAGWVFKSCFWVALPEICGGVPIGIIRALKGDTVDQILISIVGFGTLFEPYSANFLMTNVWAVLIVSFAVAFMISEFLAYLKHHPSDYAAKW